jgi:Zn-dependent protease with chaperone function
MFSKPFNLVLVYTLCIVNLLILFLPFILIASPIFIYSKENFTQGIIDMLYISFFIVSSIMIIYLILDTLFGFTIWNLTKGCKNITKYYKKHPFMKEITLNFNFLQNKFSTKNVKLLISKSSAVNAYAIGSMRKKIVVITLGLIANIRKNSESEEEFQSAIKSILAHEISHLVNKDFMPALLLFANEKATNFISRLINIFFNILIRVFNIIPIIGSLLTQVVIIIHRISSFLLNFFYRYILVKVYNLLKLHISRQTEYRCDYQAAEACGGKEMANALSFLGDNGYFTIFSSHPRTLKRIKHVVDVKKSEKKIKISIINRISNASSILILVVMLDVSWSYLSKLEYLNFKNNQNIQQIFYKQKYYLNIINNNLRNILN